MFKVNAKGETVNITPKSLIVNRKNEEKKEPEGADKTSKWTYLNFLTLNQSNPVRSLTPKKLTNQNKKQPPKI